MTASKSSVPAILPSCEQNSIRANTIIALASCNSDVVPKDWPSRRSVFPDLLTPTEAAQYLRLDELGTHTPETAIRTLNYWRDRKQLLATKYARHVWYRRSELDRFLAVKTES